MSTMQVLRAKGANKPVSHKVKIPAELGRRIADLDKRVQAAGLEVDWDGPLINTLTGLADAVERDLSGAALTGEPGSESAGAGGAAAANASAALVA